MPIGKTHSKNDFTIIELIIATVFAAIVLLPIGMALASFVRSWESHRQIKHLQEDLELASYSIKGVMEEASGLQISGDDDITLTGPDGGEVRIYRDGENDRLIIGNRTVIDGLSGLSFDQQGVQSLIVVTIEARGAGRTVSNSFRVRLRNL